MNNDTPTHITNALAAGIAAIIVRECDPQTDSDYDDCCDIARDRFASIASPLADDICTEIQNLLDARL